MGRRDTASFLYTQSVYKYITLCVNRSLASQAFKGGRAAYCAFPQNGKALSVTLEYARR